MSPAYASVAKQRLAKFSNVEVSVADACDLAFEDHSVDVVVCVYLFHEIPLEVRENALSEARRILRPGGLLVIVDSLQLGDIAEFDTYLKDFPINYHEPFYLNYCKTPLSDLCNNAGFEVISSDTLFLTKMVAATSGSRD